MTKQTYIELVKLTREGDEKAAAQLFTELKVRLTVLVKHRLWGWSKDEHDDLIQATLETFFIKIQDVTDSPGAFVVQILANKIGNELRVKRSRQYVSVANDVGANSAVVGGQALTGSVVLVSNEAADTRAESREELSRVVRAIDSLSPFCRAVFKGMIEGMYVKEIWDSLQMTEPGLSRSAFDKRVFNCRKQLRRLTVNRA